MSISRPRVLFKTDPDDGAAARADRGSRRRCRRGICRHRCRQDGRRKAEMQEMRPSGGGKLRLVFLGPTRGLIGYQGEFLTDTRGTGVMSRLFHGYAPHKGPIEGRRNGVLVSTADGVAIAYALWNLEERGPMFIEPGRARSMRDDRRRPHPRQRPRRQPAQGQAADQHPHHVEGRGGAADPADPDEPRTRRSPISTTTNSSRSRRNRSACASGCSIRTTASAPTAPPRRLSRHRYGRRRH